MKIRPGHRPSRVLAAALITFLSIGVTHAAELNAGSAEMILDQCRPRTSALLSRPDLAPYRGWIKFLQFEAETAVQGTNAGAALAKASRLADWLQRIESNHQVLSTLRGTNEWAYESSADDSGQPFKLNIPTDYDPARPAALSVYMHGYSGNHVEHSTGMSPHAGMFDLAVLGRARGGGYTALSEADVLQAIDYVQAHWRIDPDRIQLSGGSMGGGGTLRLAAHYPHRFASGRVTCGYASNLPMANLLIFPIYATHSEDDPTVPVIAARNPLALLRELGGCVIFDETNGFGHASWNYAEGNRRGEAWAERQVRPDSRSIRRLDFTALSGKTSRAWWAEVVEWGAAPKPARFILTAGADNTLYGELINITRLRLVVAESPFSRSQPLRVSVGGAVPIEIPAPLPDSLVLGKGLQGWKMETNTADASFRLHTPGGPVLLYDGSPLMIVYGTRGNAELCNAMRLAAEAASKSPTPGWAEEGGPSGTDGVPHLQNLYGRLKVKADREVTDADLQRCHLVLIGTASQNQVVDRIARRLPVEWQGGKIACSDGLQIDATNRAFSLVHYNPLAPQRLIYWVASEQASVYAPKSPIVERCARRLVGADLVVMDSAQTNVVLTRSFDSRWRWDPERASSPLLPARLVLRHDLDMASAEAIRQAAGADFSYVTPSGPASSAGFVPGTTRLSDATSFLYFNPVTVLDVSGDELIDIDRRLREAGRGDNDRLHPVLATGKIEAARRYRVALAADAVRQFALRAKVTSHSMRMTELQETEAMERFLVHPE